MTVEEANSLPVGVYRLYWDGGGSSVASVGCDARGKRWYAPANWVTVPWFDWSKVASVEMIERAFSNCDG